MCLSCARRAFPAYVAIGNILYQDGEGLSAEESFFIKVFLFISSPLHSILSQYEEGHVRRWSIMTRPPEQFAAITSLYLRDFVLQFLLYIRLWLGIQPCSKRHSQTLSHHRTPHRCVSSALPLVALFVPRDTFPLSQTCRTNRTVTTSRVSSPHWYYGFLASQDDAPTLSEHLRF